MHHFVTDISRNSKKHGVSWGAEQKNFMNQQKFESLYLCVVKATWKQYFPGNSFNLIMSLSGPLNETRLLVSLNFSEQQNPHHVLEHLVHVPPQCWT